MNKARRNELAKIKDVIEIERGKLQIVCEEEQDTMMNVPENLQECERYYDMEAYVEFMEEAIEQAQKEENEGEEPLNNLDQLVEHYYRLITSIYEEEISEVKISTKDFLIVYVDDNKIDLRLAFKEKNVVEKRRISQIEILFTSDLTTGVVEERLNQKFKLRKY